MTAQANREAIVLVNQNVGTMTTSVRDFTRMNYLECHGSKFEEDPKEFNDEVYKVLMIMGVTLVEYVELAAYQLKGVAQLGFNQ
uniref:Gag-pol polyprotein n=1 Tax=Solanum tuberosum TaxID=4113 RepID=M1B2G9_SOLTU